MGIYPGHEPVVSAIEPGELRFKHDGAWTPAAVGAGFVEIKPDYVILLVGFAEHPEEIDRRRGRGRQAAGGGAPAPEAEHPRVLPLQGRPGPGHGPAENQARVTQEAHRRPAVRLLLPM